MKTLLNYFHKRKERKRLIAEAEAELFSIQVARVLGAAFLIMAPASEFYNALKEKDEEEKTAELRIKYLKGEIKK